MKNVKSKGFRGRLGLILVTGSVVLMVFLGYYLYVQAELDRARTRNLRLLATMSAQVEQDVAGYGSVVDSLYRDCKDEKEVKDFLNDQASIYPYTPDPDPNRSGRYFAREQDLEGQVWLTLHVHEVNEADMRRPCPAGRSRTRVHARANLTEELEYFMPNDEFGAAFDLVVVAARSGKVIYQPRHAQLHVTDVRALFGAQEQPKEGNGTATKDGKAPATDTPPKTESSDVLPRTSSLTEVEIGGRRYELYAQPVQLASIPKDDIQDGNEWIILGFARPFTVFKQALRLSYPWLSAAIGALALAFLALPWVRIRYLAAHERLRRRDVLMAAATAFSGAALVFTLPIELGWLQRFHSTIEEQIRAFGDSVQQKFGSELSEMADFALAADREFRKGTPQTQANIFAKLPKAYPFTDLVFWSDSDGNQLIKWSAFPEVSPSINISTLRFFIRSQEEPPYRIGNRGVFLDGLLAPTTGTYKAVLGMAVPDYPEPARSAQSKSGDRKTANPIKLFLVAQPRSVFRTIVPPGFAFAVVDSSSGEVLFHSDTNRNRNENLFTETENDPALRAAVMARHGVLPVQYRGRRDLAYITPIEALKGSPLIVFAVGDRLYGESVAVEAGLIGLMMFGLYVAILAAALALCWVVPKPGWLLRFLWPSVDAAWRYAAIIPVMAASGVALLVWARYGEASSCALGAVGLGVFNALLAALILAPGGDWRIAARRAAAGGGMLTLGIAAFSYWGSGWTAPVLALSVVAFACLSVRFFGMRELLHSRERLPDLYAICALSIVFAVSIAPLGVFLRVAYRHETALHVKYGQQRIAESLARRRREAYWLDTDRLPPAVQQRWDAIADDKDAQPGLYHRSFYETTLREGKAGSGGSSQRDGRSGLQSALDGVLSALHVPLNIPTSRTKAIGRAENLTDASKLKGTPDPWSFSQGLLTYSTELPPAHPPAKGEAPEKAAGAPIVLTSTIGQDAFGLGALCWVALGIATGLYYMGIRSGARRIFVLDWRMPNSIAPAALPAPASGNFAYIAPPSQSDPAPVIQEDLQWVDFAQLAGADGGAALDPVGGNPNRAVAIRNFDYMRNDPAWSELKLRVLENLVLTQRRRVILISHIDPIYHIDRQPGLSDTVRQRWRAVLADFQTVTAPADPVAPRLERMQLFREQTSPKLPEKARAEIAECLARECCDRRLFEIGRGLPIAGFRSGQEALAAIERHAAAYYGYLWDTCSRDEQVLLYHIARYRFANPLSSEAAYQLYRKGLLTSDPTSWLMNLSFRRFVRSQAPPDPIPAAAEDNSRWAIEQSVVIVLVAVSVPLVLAFVISHGEGFQSYVGILTAAVGTVGTLAKLMGGRKPGAEGA